jgi:TonB-dependent SusC/RagA subfamily outer membrane receptor
MRPFQFLTVMTLCTASALSAQQPQPAVMLRGNDPLIIVDGVVLNRCESLLSDGAHPFRLSDLSTVDIEKIEVVKGQMAQRLYGANAANGVTLITTKDGRRYCRENSGAPKDDPFAAYFFPPELIMSHQSELGLQDAQRTAIVSELQKAQSTFLQLQWKMSEETEKLEKLLQPATVDEARVLEQVDRTLAAEREIKRTQIGMLIRIKNTLTPQQQAKLNELRKASK